MLVDRNSLDENAERNFCLSHFLGDLSLFGGVDMASYRWLSASMSIFTYIITQITQINKYYIPQTSYLQGDDDARP